MTGKLFPVGVKKKKRYFNYRSKHLFFYEITCTDESLTMRPVCIKKVKKRQKPSTGKAKLSCMEEHTEGSEWLQSTHLKVIFREAGHVVLSSRKPHYYLPQRFMYGQAWTMTQSDRFLLRRINPSLILSK